MVIALMLFGAMRVSEVISLKVPDIDFANQTIRFIAKGRKQAAIGMSNYLRDSLVSAIEKRPVQATHDIVVYDLHDPTKGIQRQAVNRMLAKYAKKAGIPHPVNPHMLRHTALTNLYRKTGDIRMAQSVANHAKLSTTAIYTHITPEEQREPLEQLDPRSRIARWWSRMKPKTIPFLSKPGKPFYTGETIGREKELAQLRKNLRTGIHTVLVGELGSGKRHLLLSLIDSPGLYRVENLSPVRESLVELCNLLVDNGLLEELPKGRSTKPFLEALRSIQTEQRLTLVVDTITDANKSEIDALRKLAEHWLIFTSVEHGHKEKLDRLFFGKYERIDIGNLPRKQANELARRALAGVNLQDEEAVLSHLYNESNRGNPRALLEMVENMKKTGTTLPEHAGQHKVISASLFLSLFTMILVVLRYSASALSEPSLKIYGTVAVCCLAFFLVLDRVLRQIR